MTSAPRRTCSSTTGRCSRPTARPAPRRQAVAVAGGRIVAVGPRARDLAGPRTERDRPGRAAARPRLPGLARPRGLRRPRARPLRPDRAQDARTSTWRRSATTRAPTRSTRGSPAAAGRWSRSPAGCPPRPRSTPWSRTGRCSCRTGTTTAPGSTAAPWNWPGSPGTPRTRPTGGSSATRAASRPGCCRRARSASSSRCCPATSAAEFDAALDRAQALLHSLGITGWQDAMVGTGLGGPDNFDVYLRAAESGRLTARVRGALWWERDRGAEQIERLVERRQAGRARRRRPVRPRQRQDHAGRHHREPHRRAQLALLRALRLRRATARRPRAGRRHQRPELHRPGQAGAAT